MRSQVQLMDSSYGKPTKDTHTMPSAWWQAPAKALIIRSKWGFQGEFNSWDETERLWSAGSTWGGFAKNDPWRHGVSRLKF